MLTKDYKTATKIKLQYFLDKIVLLFKYKLFTVYINKYSRFVLLAPTNPFLSPKTQAFFTSFPFVLGLYFGFKDSFLKVFFAILKLKKMAFFVQKSLTNIFKNHTVFYFFIKPGSLMKI